MEIPDEMSQMRRKRRQNEKADKSGELERATMERESNGIFIELLAGSIWCAFDGNFLPRLFLSPFQLLFK